MQPTLEKFSGDQDEFAEAILRRLPSRVDQRFLDSLDPSASRALYRYGRRLATFAMRKESVDLIRRSLLALSLSECLKPSDDDREVMIDLAPPWVLAEQLGASPAEIFESVADGLMEGPTTKLLRDFGRREKVTLRQFAWERVDTAEGPDLCWGRL